MHVTKATTISTALDRWTRSVFDSRLPLMRQIPVAVIFVLIWLLNLIDPDVVVDNSRDVHISTVIVLVATLGAALLSRRPDAWRYGYAIAAADLVTEMGQVKHPFRGGVKAQAGVEF